MIECPARLAEEALARLPPEIVATTPWGIEHRVRVTGRTATFAIDWGKSRIDPLSPDAESRVRQPWSFTASDGTGQTTWSPDQASAEAALIAIGRATGTDLAAAAGEAPPLLVIEQLDTRGPLPAGRATRTSLTIANKGRGGAYRVVAATKSSDPALHGLRYSFGKIGPGESITKYTEVTIPREHEDGKALVVVTVSEANNNVPDRYSKEVDIAHAGRPRLDVACAVSEGSTSVNETRTVDAGRQLRLRCTVTNRGDGPAVAAQVEAALGSGNGRPSTTADIPAGGKVALDVLLQVPSDVRTGESLTLTATARETDFGDSARWSLPVEVGLMQICQPPMKRDAYERKLAEIKSMGLDAATLRAYQEQLVACLAP